MDKEGGKDKHLGAGDLDLATDMRVMGLIPRLCQDRVIKASRPSLEVKIHTHTTTTTTGREGQRMDLGK